MTRDPTTTSEFPRGKEPREEQTTLSEYQDTQTPETGLREGCLHTVCLLRVKMILTRGRPPRPDECPSTCPYYPLQFPRGSKSVGKSEKSTRRPSEAEIVQRTLSVSLHVLMDQVRVVDRLISLTDTLASSVDLLEQRVSTLGRDPEP